MCQQSTNADTGGSTRSSEHSQQTHCCRNPSFEPHSCAYLLGQEVVRPAMVETTALGSAVAAGLAVGVWSGTDDPRLANVTAAERSFTPSVEADERDKRFKQWMRAVERSIGWATLDDDDGKASI